MNQELQKQIVKDKYSQIALQPQDQNPASCCGTTACCDSTELYGIMADNYKSLEGYNPDADLGLGCGMPTQFARIREGDTVVDLGSGAGNDAFVARQQTGETGKVIGIDFSEPMIQKAKANVQKLGFANIEFRQGDIEFLPLADNTANVVISNCVLNLVPDKKNVFAEVFRVLKQKGHFSISDIVLDGQLPPALANAAEMYAGCVSGAIQKDEYIRLVHEAGFVNISLLKEKKITLPDEVLTQYMDEEELDVFRSSGAGIYSITLYAEKPCCGPDSKCC